MRPVVKSNSALKVPLNEILGYQANIRVLRFLTTESVSVSYSELAKQTGITLPGIHKTVKRLLATGIVVLTGSGNQQLIELRNGHPLSGILLELFREERGYFKQLTTIIKHQIDELSVEIQAAWIYGKVAEGSDQYGDPLEIAVLGKADLVDLAAEELQNKLFRNNVEDEFDVTIEVNGITPADLEGSKKTIAGNMIHLYGVDPIIYADGRGFFNDKAEDHQVLDKRSQLAGKAWGAFIRQHPELISRTVQLLNKRTDEDASLIQKELKEWKEFLESTSVQRLAKFLESDSERATRMRQSNPFWMVVSDEEKEEYKKLLSNIVKSEH